MSSDQQDESPVPKRRNYTTRYSRRVRVLIGIATVVLLADLLTTQYVPFSVFIAFNAIVIGYDELGYLREVGLEEYFERHNFRRPSASDAVWMVVGLVASYVAVAAATVGVGLLNLSMSGSSHVGMSAIGFDTPFIVVAYALLFFLFVGPVEEYMFRHAVQRRLLARFGTVTRVVVASLIFSAAHLVVYGLSLGAFVSLTKIFALAVVLALVYEHTDNLLVPSVIHGAFNTISVLLLYLL